MQALGLCTGRTAHRGSRGIALLFHDQWHWKGVKGQRHAPAALYPPGKDPVPIVQYLIYSLPLVVASKETGLETLIELSTWSCLKIRMQDEVTV